MNPNLQAKSSETISPVIFAIVVGTVLVAVLDATDGVVYFWLTAHQNPIQVLQYIASGALGVSSYDGGLATAFAGFVLHLIISLVAVGIFVVLYARSSFVRSVAPIAGVVYGAVVWCFMNLVVLPLSAVTPTPLTPLSIVHGLIGHALFVGLPAALVARRYVPNETVRRRTTSRGHDERVA